MDPSEINLHENQMETEVLTDTDGEHRVGLQLAERGGEHLHGELGRLGDLLPGNASELDDVVDDVFSLSLRRLDDVGEEELQT